MLQNKYHHELQIKIVNGVDSKLPNVRGAAFLGSADYARAVPIGPLPLILHSDPLSVKLSEFLWE